jgi:cysteine synthase A
MCAIPAVWPRLAPDRTQRRDLGEPVRQCRQPQAHIETTGPEIWDQTGGKVDGFICAVGSGGTLAGIGMALQPKGVKIGLADPDGRGAACQFYTMGKLEAPGSSITEGIGQGRITANLEGFTPDFSYRIPDAEALPGDLRSG